MPELEAAWVDAPFVRGDGDSCVVCDDPRDEWPRDSVLVGELTRSDINYDRWEENLRPFCGSHDCQLALSGELIEMYGTLHAAARFGGPGCHEL